VRLNHQAMHGLVLAKLLLTLAVMC